MVVSTSTDTPVSKGKALQVLSTGRRGRLTKMSDKQGEVSAGLTLSKELEPVQEGQWHSLARQNRTGS